MCDLGVSFIFHFRKKKYRIIGNICTEWCFDHKLKENKEAGAIYEVILLWKKKLVCQ
jgi:hypothetical protein